MFQDLPAQVVHLENEEKVDPQDLQELPVHADQQDQVDPVGSEEKLDPLVVQVPSVALAHLENEVSEERLVSQDQEAGLAPLAEVDHRANLDRVVLLVQLERLVQQERQVYQAAEVNVVDVVSVVHRDPPEPQENLVRVTTRTEVY